MNTIHPNPENFSPTTNVTRSPVLSIVECPETCIDTSFHAYFLWLQYREPAL